MKINPALCLRKISDKYILFAVKRNSITNSLIEINYSTAQILDLVKKKKNKNAIINEISEQYKLNDKSVIKNSIDELIKMGIIYEE